MLMTLKWLWQEEEGQDLAEYGLLVVVLSLSAIAAMKSFASGVSTLFTNASSSLAAS
jgi:Flp pilus assembly pilin Flp